ncbi:MAG: hypothetical protein IPI27_00070 [Betaproteobacteria bacterium]|nr:hypothetical protein [Betaproteobacteria bacterium]
MATFFRPTLFRRFVAALLSALMSLGPVATPAYAAVTALADEPLAVRNQSKPNILMTIDDSTSMLYDFLPDYVVLENDNAGILKPTTFCRSGNGSMSATCGFWDQPYDLTGAVPSGGKYQSPQYIFQQYNMPYRANVGATVAFDVSGPGAGCETVNPPLRCSAGIDPTAGGGNPFGLKTYPAASPLSGKPYEYWLLWPAPAHNSALNKLYYNPRLNYDPPIGDDGNPLPNMNAANTSNWTQVPADPWATTVIKVDLTAKVTVGQWCNSDWTQGNDALGNPFAANPAHCRTNGTVDATSNPPADGDYSYPSPPLGITANDPFSKVDASFAPKAAWTAFQGSATASQNFYQNDNVLWCNTKSSAWPAVQGTSARSCILPPAPTCSGTTAGKCEGVTYGNCPAAPTPRCSGASAQTCNGLTGQVCNGVQSQTCNGTQAACSPVAQTCSAGSPQTCNTTNQTCNNVRPQTCNVQVNSCVTDAASCVNVWQPAGCNLVPNPEGNCQLVQQCNRKCSIGGLDCTNNASVCTDVGKCSVTNAACTAANEATACPTIAGTCSSDGNSCTSNGQCSTQKRCSVSNADCSSTACPNTGRTCDLTGAACPSGTCSPANRCGGIAGGAACTASPNSCPITGGKCSVSNAACTTNANCPLVAGTCSVSGTSCTSNANCPATGTGTCSISGLACTTQNCPAVTGTCDANSANAGNVCSGNGDCTSKPRYCSNDGAIACTGATIFNNSACTKNGACGATSGNAGTSCKLDSQCTTKPGTCDGNAVNAGAVCANASSCTRKAGVCDAGAANAGASCTQKSDCLNPLSAPVCSSGGVGGNLATTLLDDANGSGLACRRNNKDYPGVAAARNNYPDATYNVPVTGGSGPKACFDTPRYKLIPRHYWKTSVEWCDKAIATAGDKWTGFGTSTGGSCQSFRDATHVYPRYYQFGADPGTSNYTTPAFERIDLDITKRLTATFTHTWKDAQGNAETVTRTFDGATPDVSEMTNYANWFAYYRTRIQAVKTVTSLAFNDLVPGTDYRVGFHTLSNAPTTTFQDIALFDAAQRQAWMKKLFGVSISLRKETPNLDAMVRAGEYFANGGSGELAGSTDPIVLSCQKSWHMLFTDGITNQPKVPTKDVQNQDKTVPTLPENVISIPALVPGSPWPPLFVENDAAAVANSASDYATYYWVTDLRTSGSNAKNNVPSSDRDPASWQHLNFAALSLGTEGKLAAGNQSNTEKQLAAGSLKWSQPLPSVNKPDESGVDDLWHAAINGRGRFVNAQSAKELRAGMGAILADIKNQAGARAGAALTGVKLSGASNYAYRVGFEPGWSGSLTKVQVDAKTGKEILAIWNAADKLTTLVTKTAAVPEPWFTNRRIVTRDETGKAQPFLWDKLPNLQDSFAPGKPARGKALVAYLRGSSENEGTEDGNFRPRSKALGDIVNSSPVYVGAPSAPYKEGYDPGYPAWKASVSRPAMIYVGANDGMLHAVDDATGSEVWAYVPSALYRQPDPPEVVGAKYPNLLGALAFQEADLPKFKHRFLVDGPITVTDANVDGTWKTMLVGGLGKGGKSFYAVDVTDPASIKTEADAANALMWEFNHSDLGYSFGKPLITKTNAFGGKWVVVVSSGYNNASGDGKLWFLDAKDGTVLKTLSTGVGSAASPSGLAQFSAFTKDLTNYLAEQIYAGDLEGNFWRFDISDANSANWKVEKMATLTSPSGTAQPVTTAPQIEIDITNGIDRWVFVGTGKLLHENDLADTAVQTLYAFRDGTTAKPAAIATAKSRSDLISVTDADGLKSRPDKGWYDDLPTSPTGQRIIVAPQAALSIVAYLATYPSTDPCATGLPATLYAREFARGNSLLLDTGGAIMESIDLPDGGVGLDIISLEKDASSGSTDPNLVIRVEGTDKSKEGTIVRLKNPVLLGAHRMSWRLIGD